MSKFVLVLEIIGTVLLFLIFKQPWILGLGAGLIFCSVTTELMENYEDSVTGMSVFVIVCCLISALVNVFFSGISLAGANLFYGISSFGNAALCGGMSTPFWADNYDRLNRRADFSTYTGIHNHIQRRYNMGQGHIFFLIVNMVIYCVLAIPAFVSSGFAFLPLLYVLLRLGYLHLKAKFRGM